MPVLTTFKFNEPQVDESLRQWLNSISYEELEKYFTVQNRREWANVWAEYRLYVVAYSVVLIIVCIIGGFTNPTGIWETTLVAAGAGLLISPFFAVIQLGSLMEVQWRRMRWFKKQKLELSRALLPFAVKSEGHGN